MHCRHCYIGDNRKKRQLFDEDQTIHWLRERIGTGKDTLISFHGGEPFICPLYKMQKVCDAFPDAEFDATTNLYYVQGPFSLKGIEINEFYHDYMTD